MNFGSRVRCTLSGMRVSNVPLAGAPNAPLRRRARGAILSGRFEGAGDARDDFGFGGDGPLDRHDWFLEKFPDNGWSGLVKLDRDSVYETREEAKRKKEAERKAKEEEKRSKEDADQKKRAENEQANGKNSDAEGDKAGEQDEASAGKDSEGSSPE